MYNDIKILLVDDEPNSTKLMKKFLARKGFDVCEENNSIKAKELVESGQYDLIVSDLQMPDVSGFDLLKLKPEKSLFIMVTGYGSISSAVESMKTGAFDYISKPFHTEEFVLKVQKASEHIRLNRQLTDLKSKVAGTYSFSNIVGKSRKMQKVFETIMNVAKSNVNILVEGQSGTGKELVSRAIHFNGPRKDSPFVAINCSAIPDNLLESELFGHVKGAFTGAIENQKGVFEQADGGTLLLDEIADMPYHLQSKLLRVIENWEIKPLGSDKIKKVDVRLISATNQNLQEMIQQKKFREDLYYRISSVTIHIPSLNERRDDIPLLADYILKKISEKLGRKFSMDAQALDALVNFDWKGNVRELENVIEGAAIATGSDQLGKNSFRFLQGHERIENSLDNFDNVGLEEIERLYIKKVLEENNWNKVKASQILGIDRKTLYKKIREYNLD